MFRFEEFERHFEGIESRFDPERISNDNNNNGKPVYSAAALAKYDALFGDDDLGYDEEE